MQFNDAEFGVTYIQIAGRNVEFEDGHVSEVNAFEVSRGCVTIEMINAFKRDTGYFTCAEQFGNGKNYLENELVAHVADNDRNKETAFCLSWYDASLFCEWAKRRLLTEDEWLAASIVDPNVYPNRERVPWQRKDGSLDFDRVPPCICIQGHELTNTRDVDGRVVVRYGPTYVRLDGWNVGAPPRYSVDPYDWDLMQTFRFSASVR